MDEAPSDNGPKARHVIVAGYGPVGRVVADGLVKAGLKLTIIEMNARTCDRNNCADRPFVHGDVRDPAVLEQAGIKTADALVLAVPDQTVVIEAVKTARQLSSRIFIAARTNHVSFGMQARTAGADHVVVEEIVTAEAMDRAVVQRLIGSGGRETH